MRGRLSRLYFKIGFHSAPPGTLFYYLHTAVRRLYRRVRLRRTMQDVPKHTIKRLIRREGVTVAFRITGGIGDHIIAARYVRDLLATAGDFKFDIYSGLLRETVAWIFSEFKQFNACHDDYFAWDTLCGQYPLALWLTQFVVVYSDRADWWWVNKRNKKLVDICKQIDKFRPKIAPFIDNHPHLDGFLGRTAVLMDMKRHDFLQRMSGIAYGGDTLPVATASTALTKFGLQEKGYITIHNGFDANYTVNGERIGKRSTKCYPHFAQVVGTLRAECPGIHIVQLGTKTSTPIMGVHNLLNHTSISETAEILSKSLLHIDNESGLVHLASCLGIKSCVIFGPTSADYFAYDNNITIRPIFCGDCWGVNATWMKDCPRGFAEARCLSEQPPEGVAKAIIGHLSGTLHRLPMSKSQTSYPLHVVQTLSN